jgi:hypothetical protein
MKRGVVAALAALMWLSACGGGGGSLPTGPEPTAPSDGEGPVDLPGDPVNPDPGNPGNPGNPPPPPPTDGGNPTDPQTPTAPPSLWPLSAGSTWKYQIQDEQLGNFTKTVTVVGREDVPGMSPAMPAVRVHSIQTRDQVGEVYEEESWQLELSNGLVVRLREQDFKDRAQNPNPIRVKRWTTIGTNRPAAIIKSLSKEPAAGWQHTDTVNEVERIGNEPEEVKARTFQWKVVGVESVTVPAGTFPNALKVIRTKQGKELKDRTYWLVPGIGKVKEDGERLELLESYDVKK